MLTTTTTVLTPEEVSAAVDIHQELNNPFVTALLDLQTEEVEARVALTYFWEEDRQREEKEFGTLPDPRTDYEFAYLRDRQKLLDSDKYNGLITRGFLREERWLEYTYIRLGELGDEEKVYRSCIEAEEQQNACNITVQQLRLAALVVHGTEGSVVRIEELEREVRFRVLFFEEVAAREVVESEAEVSVQAARVKERKRHEKYRQAQVEIRDTEIPARWDIEGEEIPARRAIEAEKAKADRTIFGQLEWRLINAEVNGRYEIERQQELELKGEYDPDFVAEGENDEDGAKDGYIQGSGGIYHLPGYAELKLILDAAPRAPTPPPEKVETPREATPIPDEFEQQVDRKVLDLAVDIDNRVKQYSPDRWKQTVEAELALDRKSESGNGVAVENSDDRQQPTYESSAKQPLSSSTVARGTGVAAVRSISQQHQDGAEAAIASNSADTAQHQADHLSDSDDEEAPTEEALESMWAALDSCSS